jgi:hypothetical protein
MTNEETPKRRWKRDGKLDYIKIETRPPSKKAIEDRRCDISLESTPDEIMGACDAFQAIIEATFRCKTGEQYRELFTMLRKSANGYLPKKSAP